MPAGWDDWRAEAMRAMKASRPALDIDVKEEAMILAGDNGDWGRDEIFHWCLKEQCPLQCGGDAEKSMKM
eukprot:3118427-Pyramimonas_sp.AAC.1